MGAGDLFPNTNTRIGEMAPRPAIAQLAAMIIETSKTQERLEEKFNELDELVRDMLHALNTDIVPDE
jgi:flagellar capping protein FliD